jgi:uncharacterized protein (TIGR04255 family)
MTIDSLYPYAGSHAVQSAIFAVEWAEPLKTDAITAINKLATKFKNLGLSHLQHQQQFEIKLDELAQGVGANVAHRQLPNQVLGGIVFARPAGIGEITRSVSVSRQSCIITVPDYTRWVDVFADVENYLKIVLEEIAPARPLSAIGLQYIDVFNWKNDPSELKLRDIFSDKSYIPPNVFEQVGLWHLHHGFLVAQDTPVIYNRLDNVNVDILQPAGERVIQIVGAHRANLAEPMWQSHMKNRSLMLEVFTSLHDANKVMLKKLLTDQVCAKIQLNAE